MYRRVDEAEALLLRNELYYRAIKMNIRLFKWERALEIALTNKTHVDTVLGYRKRFLQEARKEETNIKFLEYAESVCYFCCSAPS
jgi:intraflagellar transport protein 80